MRQAHDAVPHAGHTGDSSGALGTRNRIHWDRALLVVSICVAPVLLLLTFVLVWGEILG